MKAKKSKFISCMICIIMLITAMIPVQSSVYAAAKSGNTSGNLANYGEVAQSGEWIYFVNYENEKAFICKVKEDGSGFAKITEEPCDGIDHLNVVDGWIFYLKRTFKYDDKGNYDGDSYHIYKIKITGGENQRLSKDSVCQYPGGCFTVYNGWIYYIKSYSGALYKIKLDGTKKTKVVKPKGATWSFCVSGDTIFYIDALKKGIYKIKTDGSSKKYITYNKKNFQGFVECQVSNGWLYCADGSGNLYRMKTSGTKFTKIPNISSHSYNLNSNWVYYAVSNKGIYKMKLDGTSKKQISKKKNVSSIEVVNNMIYFYAYDDQESYQYRMKKDGTGLKKGWYSAI